MVSISKKVMKIIKVISVLLLFIAGKLVDYYISNHADKTDFWVKFLDSDVSMKIVWIIFWAIVFILLAIELHELITTHNKEKNTEMQKELDEKNRLLEMKTGTLVTKLKDLFYYYEKEILFNHLKKLTEKNSIIHSAQVYSYSKNINTDITTIKISYVNGFAFEDVDINAMIQNYYFIPNEIYFAINDILERVKKLDIIEKERNISELEVNHQIEESIKASVEVQIEKFIKKWVPQIQNKKVDELTEEDSMLLSLIELCFEINLKISNEYNNEVYSIDIFDDPNNNMALRSIKRMGLLAGILKINEHVFKNNGYSRKKGRIYITRCFELNGKDYIILLSLFPNIIEFPKWKDMVSNISIEFINNLKKDIEIIYNNSI